MSLHTAIGINEITPPLWLFQSLIAGLILTVFLIFLRIMHNEATKRANKSKEFYKIDRTLQEKESLTLILNILLSLSSGIVLYLFYNNMQSENKSVLALSIILWVVFFMSFVVVLLNTLKSYYTQHHAEKIEEWKSRNQKQPPASKP